MCPYHAANNNLVGAASKDTHLRTECSDKSSRITLDSNRNILVHEKTSLSKLYRKQQNKLLRRNTDSHIDMKRIHTSVMYPMLLKSHTYQSLLELPRKAAGS